MKKIKNIIYRLRLKLLLLRNSFYRLVNSFDKEILIVSSNKYVNKVKEDINLCYYLMKNKINSRIVSWEDIKDEDNIIIRSVWGYQNDVDNFKKFLSNRKGLTINDINIVNKNISKKDQYDLLVKYDINTIDTKFIYAKEDITINGKCVLKPIVSASGNNTFIIESKEDVDKIEDINKGYMLQPFVEEINNGEYSIILFNKDIKYGIKRYPGVFTSRQSVEYINKDSLDSNIIDLVNKVNKIEEYSNYTFMRIDIVDNKVIEIELLDPQLFIETIPDKNERIKIYNDFVKCIKDKI